MGEVRTRHNFPAKQQSDSSQFRGQVPDGFVCAEECGGVFWHKFRERKDIFLAGGT